ncbi:DUF4290 domain-containing protein [Perlabentimonas gracilis]|uniref:DUF4290 domain-containing protein n=1 Tax=Perlabentimonas gracilis TaxID=2715279 RepID=UPI00140CC239|nr:DUF4290 domain-containing protein [Perlabentimonas gracilis]NHB69455.1 DUF4290 domain-containing protein [Perlabentimonas gracilis]
MDYNTQRKHLVLPEYGRHIQQMVNQLLEIEDLEQRNKTAKAIIAIMGNMNPHLRDINDFKHKLWDHLHIMASFNLEIESPYPKPEASVIYEKPKQVPYPSHPIKHKHYGRSISLIIEKAIELEEGELKEALTSLIANHMKKSYLIWNKDSVSDEDIIRDMAELSGGKLSLASDFKFNLVKENIPSKPRKKFQPRKK